MKWETLLCSERLSSSGTSIGSEPGRSHFHKDVDKIIFSSAFRRLGRKTQVHPLSINDHIHTRLTHSIEVGSVGRSLGIRVGEMIGGELPKGVTPSNIGEIVQAACLAHDIGNPPFGHAGEYAIQTWFSQQQGNSIFTGLTPHQQMDLMSFEGNALGFRVIAQTEYYLLEGGMRLTYATLGAFMKYPWTSWEAAGDGKGKFSCFYSELEILRQVAAKLGLKCKGGNRWCRHPLSYLMEAADDICYAILDLEDAHEMQILRLEDIEPILGEICRDDEEYSAVMGSNVAPRRKLAFLRGKAIGRIVADAADSFIRNKDLIMSGEFSGDLISGCSDHVKLCISDAKKVGREKVYNHHRKIELEIGAYTAIGNILAAFCNAAREQVSNGSLSFKSKRLLDLMGVNAPKVGDDLYSTYMRVIDYIGGMTDNYATHISQQIGGMGK